MIPKEVQELSADFRAAAFRLGREERADAVVTILSCYVNGMTTDPEHFANAICREHRTLQQLLFKLFTQCIIEWAECHKDKNFDLRNEFTCELSAKLLPILEESGAVFRGKAHTPLI